MALQSLNDSKRMDKKTKAGKRLDSSGEEMRKANILLVDDQMENLLVFEGILEDLNQNLIKATSGREALKYLLNHEAAAILLDVTMPDLDGFETASLIREREQLRSVPIIFVTGVNMDASHVFKGYSLGAVDYILKPFVPEILKSKVAVFVELYKKNEELRQELHERKQIEENLRTSKEKFRAVVETAKEAIVSSDHKGRIIAWNNGAKIMFGYSENEVLGKPITLLMPERFHQAHLQGFNRFVTTGESRVMGKTIELAGVTKDGTEIPIDLSLTHWTSENNRFFTAIIRDITDRKRAEQKLRNLNELLEQRVAERTAAVEHRSQELARLNSELEQFAYVVSHDLKEPLRMVASYCSLLQNRYKEQLDEKANEYIAYAVDGASRMSQMIDNLLLFSSLRAKGSVFQPIDSMDALQEAVQNLKMLIQEHEAVVTYDLLPKLLADRTQIVQLFQNLIHNGIKFHGEKPPQVHVSARHRDGVWLFSIRDNGIGIERQYLEQIFRIFYRLHGSKKYPGNGIGLATCKKIVEQHGGHIWVESESQQGATFYFSLPVKEVV